jgi:hypothetical protein
MNYPYGEHFLYTDCHPVLAVSFKWLSKKISFFNEYAIGILNFLMIISIFLTFIIQYYVFCELKFKPWIGLLFSLSITLLAPQIHRLGGHYALSYSIAIPLSWLLVLKIFNHENKFLILILFLNNLFWLFIHAYLGIIIISFLLPLVILKYISEPKRNNTFRYLWIITSVLLPVILFYTFAILTDTHSGRTTNPSGFFLYNAEFDDVLLPSSAPLRPLLDRLTGNIIKLEWEAWGYLGIVNSIFFITIIIISILSIRWKKSWIRLKKIFENKLLNLSLLSAFIVLLFAMAFPFKQFPQLLENIPVLKYFRATGRFVWPFYFVFTTFSAYTFQKVYSQLKSSKRGILGIIFLMTIITMGIFESIPYHRDTSKRITQNSNCFDIDQLPDKYINALKKIDPHQYQAIIAIPFYYQGSESYDRPVNDASMQNSIIFSYHTGIPNICASLTRTSIEESKRIVQVITPNYYNKMILKDITGNKPFLVVKSGSGTTEYENIILNKGKRLIKENNFEILHLEKDALFSDDRPMIISQFQTNLSSFIKQEGFFLSDSSDILYYNSFENTLSDTTMRGHGSYCSNKKGKNIFAEFPPGTFNKEKEYHVSIWMLNGEPDALNLWFRFIIEEYDKTIDTWYSTTLFPGQSEVIYNDWSLVEGTFKINNPQNHIYIISKGKLNSKALLHADELFIKENGIDVYSLEHGDSASLFYNNHIIKM